MLASKYWVSMSRIATIATKPPVDVLAVWAIGTENHEIAWFKDRAQAQMCWRLLEDPDAYMSDNIL